MSFDPQETRLEITTEKLPFDGLNSFASDYMTLKEKQGKQLSQYVNTYSPEKIFWQFDMPQMKLSNV